ncbi:MAG: carboxypeptidase-like regulatory domain-containing protein [Bryobacteraceae bacterium]
MSAQAELWASARPSWPAIIAVPALALCTAVSLLGQAGLGSITGVAVDGSGALVPGATLRLVEVASQSTRTTASNESGLFTFPSAGAGKYALTVSAAGFKAKELDNLPVNGFQQLLLGRIALEIGEGPASAVTVTAEQQLVKDSAVPYETIQARQVAGMPLNGQFRQSSVRRGAPAAPRPGALRQRHARILARPGGGVAVRMELRLRALGPRRAG